MFKPNWGIQLFKGYRKNMRQGITAIGLALILSISSPLSVWASPLTDVRYLLENAYVDPVDASVLNSATIEEMLEKLGDPYTVHFTNEEYQNFLNSMDMSFSGIGVYVEIIPEGVKVTSAITGSPAEAAGLLAGDVILKADGQVLAGLPQETALGLLRGPEGTSVQITVGRGEELLELNVLRKAIEVPTASGELLKGHIGYISLQSFGENTAEVFAGVAKDLQAKGADSWIIDVRDNPGGYLTTALNMAGFFIGDQTAMQTKERMSESASYYKGTKQEFIFDEPVMFLTNENSASASEILSAVVKDYHKAMILGNTTYGKGSVQSLFMLSEGGVLKMTVAKFFSPLGKEINHVGVAPDLKLVGSDPQRLAELLLDTMKPQSVAQGDTLSEEFSKVQLNVNGSSWEIPLNKVRTVDYWANYAELVRTLSHTDLRKASESGWTNFAEEDWTAKWPLFYPEYQPLNQLSDLPLDKKFTVRFTAPINWETVTAETLELVESESGTRVPVVFEPVDTQAVRVIPEELLKPGKTYWLITHRGIQGQDGVFLGHGALAVVKTANSEEITALKTMEILKPAFNGVADFMPAFDMKDYGQAIKDIK
jgi:carboxyl-terminal processing protease